MANSQDGYYHQHLARGHDGATRQMYAPSVQGARGQPSQPGVESNLAGPGMVRTPSVYSPPGHSPPGVVTSPPPQIGYQQTNRPYVALSPSNGGRGTSQQSGNMSSVPSSSGQYAPNPPATHVPPITSASPMRQQWSEGGYRASGGGVSPTYVTAELQPSPTTRTSGGRAPSQSHSSNPTRYNLPRCKMPHCDKPAIFDQHINEQREYCEEHIKCAISVGYASCCSVCRKMPARLDSEFCSESCSNLNVRRRGAVSPGTPGYHQPALQYAGQQIVPPSSHPSVVSPPVHTNARQSAVKTASSNLCENCQSSRGTRKKPCTGECAAAGNSVPKTRRSDKNEVPDGLGPTCQECRGFMKEALGRYCSKACEEASRKPRTSRP